MKSKKHITTKDYIFIILILSSIILFLVGMFLNSPTLQLRDLLKLSPDNHWLSIADEELRYISTRSSKPFKWRINELRNDTDIRLIMFDSRKSTFKGTKINQKYVNNCGYLNDGQTIVCDIIIFENLINRYGISLTESFSYDDSGHITKRTLVLRDESIFEIDRRFLMRWVLSHEIGHMKDEHSISDHGFDSIVSIDNYCHENELEADSYLLTLPKITKEEIQEIFDFLINLINKEIRLYACPNQNPALYCDQISLGAGMYYYDQPFKFTSKGTHPDYIIRIVRMLWIVRNSNEFGLLNHQIKQLVEYNLLKIPNEDLLNKPCWL